MNSLTDETASRHLGKKSAVSEFYDPSLLVAVLRDENRKQYEINSQKLPFSGFDVWHAYEFSFLTQNGLPVTRVIKIKYDCESEFIVESKSLKLYLNSFNMTKFGHNANEGLNICKTLIQNDLSKILNSQVQIEIFGNKTKITPVFQEFADITEQTDEDKIRLENYKEAPELLKIKESENLKEYRLKFDSLRSNCRVTHQPDFGDAFIYYKSKKHIDEESLVAYLTSFRSEYHFHEECCEMIFKRISDILDTDDELLVCTLYTRRGGIDINPIRYKNCNLNDIKILGNMQNLTRNGIKQ